MKEENKKSGFQPFVFKEVKAMGDTIRENSKKIEEILKRMKDFKRRGDPPIHL